MSTIKVNFEIGHEASIRTKKTVDGFTHDWEVYVRGVDNADISMFVDKVVFQLHETFPKPKRVVKEPPYCVRESGYAGFNLPIEIYLKNRDEPKKIRFNYDLHLQQSGPPIIKVQKEKYVFNNPSEDFKRKLLKGGGMIVPNNNLFAMHPNIDHERSRDSYTEEKPPQLIGKPKLSGDSTKKHKSKDHRQDDLPRPSNNFVNLFGPPIHKTSHISPNPRKLSPSPKSEKKEKDKPFVEKDKIKSKSDFKEKDDNKFRDDKAKSSKEERDKGRDEKKSKSHKERDSSKDKGSKRLAERPLSPAPPPKKPATAAPPSPKSNVPPAIKEEMKSSKYAEIDNKLKSTKSENHDIEKKSKKEKKSHDKDKESKKEHKKEKEPKTNPTEKDIKPQESSMKESLNQSPMKERHLVKKVEKPFNKFSIDNMLKDPNESKHRDSSKHKDKGDKERKHKHKKKDKKRDESREKSKESSSKEKKHKHEKHSHREKYLENKESLTEKPDPSLAPREIDKTSASMKPYKEKDRSQLTISPISVDTSSQSSSKSVSKKNKLSKSSVLVGSHSSSSNSESEASIVSDDEDVSMNSETNNKSSKLPTKTLTETIKVEPTKQDLIKMDKHLEKNSSPSTSHKLNNKDKSNKHENKDKKSKKRKNGSKDDLDGVNKVAKVNDEESVKSKRDSGSGGGENAVRVKAESSPRLKTDTKVQDDGVSSSLSDHPLKCDSPLSEDTSQVETNRKPISPDYMLQLKELQQRIMTIQSNDELERVVNLIAETGKYEVTKKTFDFDLCLLDRSTVQQLQELIGCESRA